MNTQPPQARLPQGHHCPVCGSRLERQHRHIVDRWVSLFRSMHRYRCTAVSCGWEGLLGRIDAVEAGSRGPPWRMRLLWFAVGAATALAAVQAVRLVQRKAAAEKSARAAVSGAEAQSRATAPGRDFDGEFLHARDERVVNNPTPLTLRKSCAWGVPGSNRYRGTVEQALAAASLPQEVVRQISDMAKRGWVHDQVEISRTGIRTVDQRRHFGTTALAMAFGNTLCFNTRVNFVPGHIEYASLYEAADSSGRTYTVMVPYVCQNVAVLGERAEDEDNTAKVPEPASWALALLGVGLMATIAAGRQP